MDNQNKVIKTKKKADTKKVLTIIAAAILVLSHIAILLIILQSWRYYGIYPSLFGSIVAIVLCFMAIIDIIFFVGFNHKDLALKVISSVLAVLLFAGGTVGVYFLNKANTIVNNVLDDGSPKYETYSGVFTYYDKNNKFSSLSDLSGKRVGMVVETSDGITSIATKLLSKEKIDYATVDYKSSAELLQALIDGDVDAIVINSAYKDIYKEKEGQAEEEISPFAKYLDNMVDFYSFEEDIKISSNKPTKNISKEPFNVLLIGYSRTDIGSSVGLADSIILATINPQTYTVSMMSIARDSFVPISCYGGELDKINSGRSTSRACFIETVENFIGMDIDYYMELDYLGLVQIVNTIGGVRITNPVEFTLDGIYVPEGTYVADGQQALQFCRERHHMPNGDFDRQQHQKEVIMGIAKKLVQSGDVTLALNAMNAASDWMSTDLTLNQLTGIFNLLLNTKNYTGLSTFDLIDFHALRITGYGGILYYSMSMRLPLWVYLIYQGSYDESIQHIKEVMGEYKTVNQEKNFEFSSLYPYSRPLFYSLDYEQKFCYEPPKMPPYWANLEGSTLADAMSWASSNGVKLSVNYIKVGDSGYVQSQEGQIVGQSPRYGALISEYPAGSITIMGTGEIDESKQVPNFVGKSYDAVKEWAKTYGVPRNVEYREVSKDSEVGKVVEQSPAVGTMIDTCIANGGITVYVGYKKFGTSDWSGKTTSQIKEWVNKYLAYGATYKYQYSSDSADSAYENGSVISCNTSDLNTYSADVVFTIKVYEKTYSITYNYNGGNDPGNPKTYTARSSFALTNPTRGGYRFTGWSGTDISGTSTNVYISEGSSGDRSYTANWEEIIYYTIIFNVDGAETEIQAEAGTIPSYPGTPYKEGHDFVGWAPEIVAASGNTTYSAVFEPISSGGGGSSGGSGSSGSSSSEGTGNSSSEGTGNSSSEGSGNS